MERSDNADRSHPSGWRSGNVWARADLFDDNPVKQLLVPASTFSVVSGKPGALEVQNSYGSWSAASANKPLGRDTLWVQLPLGATPGDDLIRAQWNVPNPLSRSSPDEVLHSYQGAISFDAGTDSSPGLRSPQLGALHAVLGYWTTKRMAPATVVMPTGTGKTETMLALLVAARPSRLLVLVPSDSLREQVATKFETLGVLQELGIVTSTAARPIVGRVNHGFTSADTAKTFAEACNVIIATPQSLKACAPDALGPFLASCTHLFIDEAHHVAARTWSEIRNHFTDKPVVQFTATPFREDGKHLQGRNIYSFPLREAQDQGYFSTIDYDRLHRGHRLRRCRSRRRRAEPDQAQNRPRHGIRSRADGPGAQHRSREGDQALL
jgi:hypothetical protein